MRMHVHTVPTGLPDRRTVTVQRLPKAWEYATDTRSTVVVRRDRQGRILDMVVTIVDRP